MDVPGSPTRGGRQRRDPPSGGPSTLATLKAAAALAAGPLPVLLLGILFGSRARRELIRCTWMRTAPPQVRALFVVGMASAEPRPDVLPVNVTEGQRMWAHGDTAVRTTSGKVVTGSVTTYRKLTEWLQYAATQPEPMVGRADDDAFLSPRMLLAHATLLLRQLGATGGGAPPPAGGPLIYAGVFEWYAWRTRTLHSTAFGWTAGASRANARKPWRNCTAAAAAAWHALLDYGDQEAVDRLCRDTHSCSNHLPGADVCIGPVAFAKGPLVLLSAAAVRAAVGSPLFARDVARANAMAEGRAPGFAGPGSGRIDDDVQLGYWMSQVPGLRVVTVRRYYAWHDRWKPGVLVEADRLLVAHKTPWFEYAPLLNRTEGLWRASAAARVRIRCNGPPCTECAHLESQLSCAVDVLLLPGRVRRSHPCARHPPAGAAARRSPSSQRGSSPTCRFSARRSEACREACRDRGGRCVP